MGDFVSWNIVLRDKHSIKPNLGFAAVSNSEPVFVNLSWSPRTDSQPGGPVWQPYLLYRPAGLHRLSESIPRNLFPGSLNIYKYGLCSWINRSLTGDKVNSGIGLSYRPAVPCIAWRASTTTQCRSWLYPPVRVFEFGYCFWNVSNCNDRQFKILV